MQAHAQSRDPASPGARFLGLGIRLLLVLVVALVAGFFAWMVTQRLTYSHELEWMEGAMGDHVSRVLDGHLIYTEPSYEHVAYLYPPGFFYISALVAQVTGLGHSLVPLRIVSVLATLLTCFFLYRLVRRDGTWVGGLVAVGVYFASYFLAGCYYDTGRIDPLFNCLLLGGIDQLRAARSWKGLALAAAWFLAAWLTKQTAALILPVVVLGSLPAGFRRGAVFGVVVAVVCGLTVWILDLLHDGWLSYFTLELPRNHGFEADLWPLFITHDLPPMLIGLGLFAVFVMRGAERSTVQFHAAWIAACFIGGVMSRLHAGGAENVLLPTIAAVAAAAGLGVSTLGYRSFAGRCWGEGLATLHLLSLFLLPFIPVQERYAIPMVPSAESAQRSVRLIEELRAARGPVFLPWHGSLSRLAGKPPTAHIMAMDDVWRSGNTRAIEAMAASIRARFATAPYPVVYVSDPLHARMRDLVLSSGYRIGRDLKSEFEFRHPVGAPFFPQVMMVKGP